MDKSPKHLLLWACALALANAEAKPDSIEVYLLGGQSNADGHGNPKELDATWLKPVDPVLFYHGNGGELSPLAANTWIALQPGSGSKQRNTGDFGPELSFGRSMYEARGSDSHRIAIIKYAVGGSNLAVQWNANGNTNKQGDGPLYRKFQQTVADGLSALREMHPDAEIRIIGMLWHQGESDTHPKRSANYEKNLTRFIADIRSNYGNDLIFLIGQLSKDQYTSKNLSVGFDKVVTAQASVAGSSELNGLVVSQGLPVDLPDNRIHFGTEGQIRLGKEYASQALKALQKQSQ